MHLRCGCVAILSLRFSLSTSSNCTVLLSISVCTDVCTCGVGVCTPTMVEDVSILSVKGNLRLQGGGGSEVSTEPPFLAGYVINLVCTVKDPGFMEPPFLPFS